MHNNLIRKYYFIDKFNKSNIDKLDNNTTIIYRNYSKNIDKNLVIQIRDYCRRRKIKFILSNNVKLALKLNLDGAYIPSFNKDLKHLNYSLKKKFLLVGSAHKINEIRIKEIQKVEEIFLSSIFKKNKNYLGINKFNKLSSYSKKKIIALGGISLKNINSLTMTTCSGFAGISYFQNKKGP